MIHLIWHGKGWCVPASVFGCSLLTEIITRDVTKDNNYYQNHGLPMALAFIISGIIIGVVFYKLRKVITDEDGRVVTVVNSKWIDNSFFFISIKMWAVIMPVIGLLIIGIRGL